MHPRQFRHALGSMKSFARDTYYQGRKWAQNLDGYASVFRRGLGAASGLLREFGPGGQKALAHGERALRTFDDIKERAVGVDKHISRIGEALS